MTENFEEKKELTLNTAWSIGHDQTLTGRGGHKHYIKSAVQQSATIFSSQ